MRISILKLGRNDLQKWVKFRCDIWPEDNIEESMAEFKNTILNKKSRVIFIALGDNGLITGFIEVSIRCKVGFWRNYAGYIENLHVKKEFRRKGIAKILFKFAEKWMVSKRCSMALSDTSVENHKSQKVHKMLGFKEEERLILFSKEVHCNALR